MELPLFPLNSVLFPGMPLRLYIFEERYKTMMNECIDNQSPLRRGSYRIRSGGVGATGLALHDWHHGAPLRRYKSYH